MASSVYSYDEAQEIIKDAVIADAFNTTDMRRLGFLAKLCVAASDNGKDSSFIILVCNKFYSKYFEIQAHHDCTGTTFALYQKVAEILALNEIKHFQA